MKKGRSSGTGCRFTNTAVPRFNGDSCWQQHLQIFQAIMKSNGWMDETAALQLFAHLNGEALNLALLMPEGERAVWKGLSHGLSDYYNSPGRLAVFRWQFESATRRTGMDPATFATEMEILAVRGFGDMSKCARNWIVRDRFIAAQRSCGLRRHLDSVPPDTPIRDIVDHCRVWGGGESFGEGDGVSPGCWPEPGPSGDVRGPPGSWICQTAFTQASWVSRGGFTDSGARG